MIRDKRATVVLADDHRLILVEVSRVLSSHFDIVATAGDGMLAVRVIAENEPDVAVLDISMPSMDGFAVARKIQRMQLRTQVVFLSCFSDSEHIHAAQALGAGYVLKSQMWSNLRPAIISMLAPGRMGTHFKSRHRSMCLPIKQPKSLDGRR